MLNQLQAVFESLHRHNVKYVVIGGIAAILHGVPRATFDLDILIEPTEENARKLLDALLAANLGTAALVVPAEILQQEITVFNDWVRIDVQVATPGLQFDQAFVRCEKFKYKNVDFYVVSKADLIAAKAASGRPKDLEDIRMLEAGDS